MSVTLGHPLDVLLLLLLQEGLLSRRLNLAGMILLDGDGSACLGRCTDGLSLLLLKLLLRVVVRMVKVVVVLLMVLLMLLLVLLLLLMVLWWCSRKWVKGACYLGRGYSCNQHERLA